MIYQKNGREKKSFFKTDTNKLIDAFLKEILFNQQSKNTDAIFF